VLIMHRKIKCVDKIMLPRQSRIISTACFIDHLARSKGVHRPASMPRQKESPSASIGVAMVSTMGAYCQDPGWQFTTAESSSWELWDT
jgi:hypothetical protein